MSDRAGQKHAGKQLFVELGGKKSRWRTLKNGLLQGSVLAPLLFNIYTNDQPKSVDTHCFIYADDLGMAAQDTDFKVVEDRLSNALEELTPYFEGNHLRVNLPTAKSGSQASTGGQLVRNCP